MTRFTVEHAGRADAAVRRRFPAASRRQVGSAFSAGAVRRDGQVLKKATPVRPGDTLEVNAELADGPEDLSPTPQAAEELSILHTAPDWLAVNKRPAVHTHPLDPGELGTVANAVIARFPECATASEDAREGGLVHRLDKGTSGVLVFARSRDSHRTLRDAFARHQIQKTYLALVDGRAKDGESSRAIDNRGDHVVLGLGMPAHSKWTVLERQEGFSLIRVTTSTGRRHQVRAHLADAGWPIVGDVMYGGSRAPAHLEEFFLHAESIDGLDVRVSAGLPEDRLQCLGELGFRAVD